MRSEAARACWMLALTRLNFLAGEYIMKSAATKATKSPGVSRPDEISRLP